MFHSKIISIDSKPPQKLLFISLFFVIFTSLSSIYALPRDVITTVNNNKILFCGKYKNDTKLTLQQISSAGYINPIKLDYCAEMYSETKLNSKHYSSEDEKLRQVCPSNSVYRVISKVDYKDDGSCEVQLDNIDWYCDDANTVMEYSLPVESYYCPDELDLLRCPHSAIDSKDTKMLSDVEYTNSNYCDYVMLREKHYVGQDQKLATYTQTAINELKAQGAKYANQLKLCSSGSVYRIITSKAPRDSNGNCKVTYDVYCENGFFPRTPYEQRICPKPEQKATTTVVKETKAKSKSKSETEIEVEVERTDDDRDSDYSDNEDQSNGGNCDGDGNCCGSCMYMMPTCGGGCNKSRCQGNRGSSPGGDYSYTKSIRSKSSSESSSTSTQTGPMVSTPGIIPNRYSDGVYDGAIREENGIRYQYHEYSGYWIPVE